MMQRRTFLKAAGSLPLILAVSPLLAQGVQHPALRIVTSFTIRDMDPTVSGFWFAEFGVAEQLVQFRQDGRHHPWLLESWNNVDPLTWVLTLRPGIRFQNGRAVDAAAVVACMRHRLDHAAGTRSQVPADFAFEATGPLEITCRTGAPFPAILSALSSESGFIIYDSAAVEAVAPNWGQLAGAGIWTGPYSIVSLDSARLVLTRNETYWQGQPALPGVTVSFVADTNARILAVQNGEADIALYPPTAVKNVIDASPGVHFNFGTPGTGAFFFYTNFDRAPFDDVRVRRAVNLAIDYAQMANVVFQGVFDVADSLYTRIAPFRITNQRTDPEAARALLDAAGWAVGSGGVRSRDSQPLQITVLTYPQQPDSVTIGQALQAQLRPFGIVVDLLSVEDIAGFMLQSRTMWHGSIASAGSIGFGGMPEAYINRYLVSTGDRNYGPLRNPEIDGIARELDVTIDEARRTALLQRLQTVIIEDEAYSFPLVLHQERIIVGDRYRNHPPAFTLYHVSWETRPAS